MRLATIDVGTNTALLLIAEVAPPRQVAPLYEAQRFVRLGEGVDASGLVGPAALERLRTVLEVYRQQAEQWQVEAILVGATSASRDARNRAALIDFVRRETGLHYEILSGEEEALWSFQGAVSAFDDLAGPCVALDIGGGSTEIVVGTGNTVGAEEEITYHRSLDVGAVRLTERLFEDRQPPAPSAVRAAEELVRRALAEAAVPASAALPLVGVAGTAQALALVHHGVPAWQPPTPSEAFLTYEEVHRWRTRLFEMTYEEVLHLNPAVMEGRADVFPAGVLLLDVVMQHLGVAACRVSPRGLQHGLALRFLDRTSGAGTIE